MSLFSHNAFAKSVRTKPGAMQFARMFFGPHSTQMLRASAMSAALEMPYTPSDGEPSKPAIEDTMMIEPPPRSAICGSTMLHNQKLLRTLLFITLSYASSDMLIDGPKYGFTAALHTRMSMPPHFCTAAFTSDCRSSLRPMLHA